MSKKIQKFAVFFCGIPASGKSTQRNALIQNNEVGHVSMDEIREELTGSISDQTRNAEVAKLAMARWKELLQDDVHNICILDNTNYNRKNRKSFLKIAQDLDIPCQAFVFNISLEEAKQRNSNRDIVVPDHVLERMFNGFQMPTLEEGFVSVQEV